MTLISFVKWFGRLPARRNRGRRWVRPLRAELLEDRSVPHGGPTAGPALDTAALTFLPDQHFLFEPNGYLSGPAPADALAAPRGYQSVALGFLAANAGRLGLTPGDVADPVVSSAYADDDGGPYHLYLKQEFNGLAVLNADLGVHLTADGKVIAVGGGFVPGLAALEGNRAFAPTPALTADQALAEAAADLGYAAGSLTITSAAGGLRQDTVIDGPGVSLDPITAHLSYVDTPGGVRLAWEYVLRTPDGAHWYNAAADAATGELVFASDWIDDLDTYNVYPLPAENPVDGPRTYLVNPADPNASPFGWHDTNGVAGGDFTDTRGNNAFAQDDTDDNDIGGGGTGRPSGGPDRFFDSPLNLTLAPSTYLAAATTNLFYLNNILHDVHQRYGFTELAGNFQQTNYSGSGLGGDGVRADAQDGSGTNNANFGTPPDGSAPRMQQYIFTSPNPDRDSDLDAGIVAHEYGHGVTNRLTGGPANSNALNNTQSGGMGEGWGDFYALMLTQKPTDTQNAAYPVGTYSLGQAPTGGGIRRFPYSFNMTIDPLTWDAYGTSGTTPYGIARSSQVHNTGEIWCSALWDMNWLLINKYGYDPDLTTGYAAGGGPASAGNKLALRLVMDALKLQPANPSFTDARDAILTADVMLTGGVNQREIWAAFARRGLGSGSATPGSSSTATPTLNTALPAAFSNPGVTGQSPTGLTGTAPSQITFTFSEAMNTGSFDPATDVVSFTGPGGTNLLPQITGFTWTTGTTLQVNFDSQTTQGLYTLVLGPQVLALDDSSPLNQDGDLTAGEAVQDAYTAYVRYDAATLTVAAVNPANAATVTPGLTTIDVTFSEAIAAGSVDPGDLQLSYGTVTGASLLTSTTARYTVSGLGVEGTVYLNVKYGAVTDAAGFPVQFYGGTFVIDVGTQPLPLTALSPVGSVVYQGSTPGLINAAGDVDNFTITLDAGARVSVAVTSAAGLRTAVELRDPSNALVGTATATAAGLDVLLNGLTAPAAGTYRVVVSGATSTTGTYAVRLLLNPAVEAELYGGPTNDALATAQNLDATFTTAIGSTQTAAVVGRTSTSLITLANEVEGNDTTATANSAVANFAAQPGSTLYQMGISGTISSGTDLDWFNLGPLQAGDRITVSLAARGAARGTMSDPFVELWRASGGTAVATDDDAGSGIDSLVYRFMVATADTYYVKARGFDTTVTGTYQLGVWLENTGTAPTTGGSFTAEAESNNTLATANDASGSWRQVQYLSRTTAAIGTPGDEDLYRFQLTAGDLITVFADSTSSLDAQVAILNSAGVLLAQEVGDSTGPGADSPIYAYRIPSTGTYYVRAGSSVASTGAYNADVYLSTPTAPPVPVAADDFFSLTLAAGQRLDLALSRLSSGSVTVQLLDSVGAPLVTGTAGPTNFDRTISYTATAAGTYYVRITDPGTTDYDLVAVRAGVFDQEPNDSFAAAQTLPVGTAAVGAVTAANDDWYRVTLTSGDFVTLLTATPATGSALPLNLLDPRLELYNPSGVLIASDDNSAPDLRNARITIVAPVSGDFRVRVAGVASTGGEYAVSVTAVGNPAPTGVSAGGPYAISEGSSLTLSGTAVDPNGDPLTYSWDVNGDGTFGDVTGQNPTISWAALQALGLDGPFTTANLRVVVSDGFTPVTSAVTTLTIGNVNPTAVLGNGGSVTEGSTGSVTFTGQTDPSPGDVTAGFRYSFDFDDDGTYEVGNGATYAGSVASATATVPASFLADNPSRTIRARIFDRDGGFTQYTTTITITNANPTAALGNGGAVTEGSSGSVTFTGQLDPSSVDTGAGFRYSYDFDNDGAYEVGDGTTYAGSVTAATATVPASYLADGPAGRTVRARIFDKDGGFTEYATAITVTNANPTAALGNGGTVTEGGAGSVTFSAQSDPSPADIIAGFRYSFDFDDDGVYEVGNGTTYAGSVASATAAVPASFLADNPGRTVRARIFDKDGGFTQYTTTITVTNVAPTATLGNGGAVTEGGPGTVSFSAQSDPSSVDTGAGFRYSYDFNDDGTYAVGDGTTYVGSVTTTSVTVPASFLADNPGRTIRARVFDKDGGFTQYTTTITVTNVAPTATLGNGGAVTEGGPGTVSFSAQSDPSSVDTGAGFRYSYDFNDDGTYAVGDGTSYAGSVTSAIATVPASFLADNPGRTVRARIFDKDGGFTQYTTTITVNNANPTATLGNGGAVTEGSAGSVSFSAQSDPSSVDTGAGLRYSFDFDNDGVYEIGDGTTYAGSITSASVAVPASFLADNPVRTIRARIFDKDGGFTQYTTTITVTNVDPTATPAVPAATAEGDVVTVSLDAPTDPSPADTAAGFRYSFDFDDDGDFTDPGDVFESASASAGFAFPDSGSYTVRARITDQDGGFTEYTATAVVTNVAPTATLGVPVSLPEGGMATVSLTAVVDPSAGDAAAGFRYSFARSPAGLAADYASAGTAASAAFTLPDNGTVTLFARVFDHDGGTTTYSGTVAVTNVAPTATGVSGPANLAEAQTGTYALAGPADPGADTLRYSFALSQSGLAANYAAAGAANTFPVTPTAAGSFTVFARVYDEDGGVSPVFQRVITVGNEPPTATLTASGPVPEGSAGSVSFSAQADPSPEDTAAGFHYSYDFDDDGTFDLGDGTTYAGSVALASVTVPPSFLADNPGRTVRARIFDRDGAFGEYTTTLTVTNVAPTATLTGPATVVEGGTATVSFGGVSDPSTVDAAALRFSYDFDNDGTFDLGDGTYTGSVTAGSAAVPAALLAHGPATLVVRGRVLDKDGGSADATTTIGVTAVPVPVPVGQPFAVSGAAGGTARVFGPDGRPTGAPLTPFPGFGGEVRVASGDFNADGTLDAVLITGPGTKTVMSVVSGKDGKVLLPATDPFGDANFTFGGFVTAGDIDGDGRAEWVVTPELKGGPRVIIFRLLADGSFDITSSGQPSLVANFFGIGDPAFRDGDRAALGDVNGDGVLDVFSIAAFNGGPRNALYNGADVLTARAAGRDPVKLAGDFFAAPSGQDEGRGGRSIAVGDVNGDGRADLIVTGDNLLGTGNQVTIFSGADLAAGRVPGFGATPLANFAVGGQSPAALVSVAAVDADGDGKADVAVGSGAGQASVVKVYPGKTLSGAEPASTSFDPFGTITFDGVFVG